MLGQWERWAFVYELRLEPYPVGAPEIDLEAVLDGLLSRQQAGQSVKLVAKETAAIRIQAMQVDKDARLAKLLINYADKDTSDPVFAHLETGSLRSEPKLDGEGVALSAHMLIHLDRCPKNGTYTTILEDVPGVGKSKVTPFLTSEFRAVADFPFKDSDGKVKKSRPVPNLVGHLSQKLKEDLNRGHLGDIELVRYRTIHGEAQANEFDEEGYVSEESRTVRIKVEQKLSADAALDLLNRVRSRAVEKGYAVMRVKVKPDQGKERTVPVPTAREDAGDVAYVRYERMDGFEQPLKQSVSDLQDTIVEKMRQLLETVRREQAVSEA